MPHETVHEIIQPSRRPHTPVVTTRIAIGDESEAKVIISVRRTRERAPASTRTVADSFQATRVSVRPHACADGGLVCCKRGYSLIDARNPRRTIFKAAVPTGRMKQSVC